MTENELPANLKGLWDKAKKSMRMQNYDYVAQLLIPIVKAEPGFTEARSALRKAQMAENKGKRGGLLSGGAAMKVAMKLKSKVQSDPQAVLAEIEDELSNSPGNKALNEVLYDAAMAAELPTVGLLALDTMKESNPKDTGILKKIAAHHAGQREFGLAAEAYQAVTMLDPADLEAINGSMKMTTQKSMADNQMEDGGKKRNEEEAARLEIEDREVGTLTKEQRERLLEKLLADYAENNENIIVVKKIAAIYEHGGDLESAISYYEWALHLSAGDSAMQGKITGMKDKKRDIEFKEMEDALAANPDAPDAADKRARLDELKRERLMQKVEYFRDQVERNPTDPQLRFSYAEYLFLTDQPTEAIPELQRAKSNPHVRTKALLLLGKCFSQKNMNDLAITQLQEAEKELTTMDGVKKDVVYERALLHEKRDEKAEYLEALKEIYEVDYGYRDVAKRVESSYE